MRDRRVPLLFLFGCCSNTCILPLYGVIRGGTIPSPNVIRSKLSFIRYPRRFRESAVAAALLSRHFLVDHDRMIHRNR
jgi:hypothetical protein